MGSITERKGKGDAISYRARIRRYGNSETSTFSSRQEADRWIKLKEHDLHVNLPFIKDTSKDSGSSYLREIIERYLKSIIILKKEKTQVHQIQQLKWWMKEIGHLSLHEVTSSLLSRKRDELIQKGYSASTVRRYLFALSHVLSTCVKEWELIESNPMNRIRKPQEPKGRTRFLNLEEVDKLLRICHESPNKNLYYIVKLAILTGGRREEILRLQYEDINLDRKFLIFRDTKNEEDRRIPLSELAVNLIYTRKFIQDQNSGFLFPSRKGIKTPDIKGAWNTARKKAQLKDFKFHDLRHTFASHLAMNGASLLEIAKLLGHKKLEMVKRYAHLTEDYSRGVLEKMNKELFNDPSVL